MCTGLTLPPRLNTKRDRQRALTMQGELPLGPARAFSASRQIYARDDAEAPAFAGVYFIVAGEWRVTIRVSGSKLESMDAFVRDQRWETLNDH